MGRRISSSPTVNVRLPRAHKAGKFNETKRIARALKTPQARLSPASRPRGNAAIWEDARKCADYIAPNRRRMRYPAFRAIGLCVSTGVVEGGCKNIVGGRIRRGGMHWIVDGTNAILAPRCTIIGVRFDDFWECHASRKMKRFSQI